MPDNLKPVSAPSSTEKRDSFAALMRKWRRGEPLSDGEAAEISTLLDNNLATQLGRLLLGDFETSSRPSQTGPNAQKTSAISTAQSPDDIIADCFGSCGGSQHHQAGLTLSDEAAFTALADAMAAELAACEAGGA